MTSCLEEVNSFHYGPALEVYYRIMGVILKYINSWKLTEKLIFKTDLYKLYHPGAAQLLEGGGRLSS